MTDSVSSVKPPHRRFVMSAAQVYCSGCNRVFTASGYAQHISKMLRADCRLVLRGLHASSASRLTPGVASSLASNSSSTSHITHHTSVNGIHGTTENSMSNEIPTVTAGTCTATHAAYECTFLSTHEHFSCSMEYPRQ